MPREVPVLDNHFIIIFFKQLNIKMHAIMSQYPSVLIILLSSLNLFFANFYYA